MRAIITKTNVAITEREQLTSGMVGKTIDLKFSSDWNGLNKTAVFSNGAIKKEITNPQSPLKIPYEVLTSPGNVVSVGFYGYAIRENIKITAIPTIYAELGRVELGAELNGDPATEVTATVTEQIQSDIGELENRIISLEAGGCDGKSAYEIAVDNGYSGTEEEWLVSLQGADGKDGYTPVKGIDYFDGAPGKDGKDGADGYTPQKGIDYFDGAKGETGADGYTPIKGVDYWTDADKAEIVADIPQTSVQADWTQTDYNAPDYIKNKPSVNKGRGQDSIAENDVIVTDVAGRASHAEGVRTATGNMGAHAEGIQTSANGRGSHTEGGHTQANGMFSHAEGDSTIVATHASHVEGKFNIADGDGKYAHILGNGSSDTERSNAHTIDWEGNAWFAGSVSCAKVIPRDGGGEETAVQSDWAQNDTTAPDYIKNRCGGYDGMASIEWDGDTTGRAQFDLGISYYYSVSDETPSADDLDGCTETFYANGNITDSVLDKNNFIKGTNYLECGRFYIAYEDNAKIQGENVALPKKGVYFMRPNPTVYVSKITYRSTVPIASKYLPMAEIKDYILAALPNGDEVSY